MSCWFITLLVRCHILQRPTLLSIHLLLWVVMKLYLQLIGAQFVLLLYGNFFSPVLPLWMLLDSNVCKCFSEVNSTRFCGEWNNQMGASGTISYMVACFCRNLKLTFRPKLFSPSHSVSLLNFGPWMKHNDVVIAFIYMILDPLWKLFWFQNNLPVKEGITFLSMFIVLEYWYAE